MPSRSTIQVTRVDDHSVGLLLVRSAFESFTKLSSFKTHCSLGYHEGEQIRSVADGELITGPSVISGDEF